MKKIIIGIVACLVIIALFLINKKTFDSKISSDIINSGNYCTQTNFYNITDASSNLVTDAKRMFLNTTNISEKYFNQHFKFECAADAPNGKHVIYRYTMGDYSTEVYLIKSTGSSNNKYNDYIGLPEIKELLPKKVALEKLEECLKASPKNLNIRLTQKTLLLDGVDKDYIATLDLQTGECDRFSSHENE